MKRMRYLAGAAGIAPVALGLGIPTAAAAAATTGPARLAPLVPGSQVTPDFGQCNTSYYKTWARHGNLRGHFWWAESHNPVPVSGYCVGTAVLSVYFNKTTSKSVTVHFSGAPGTTYKKTYDVQGTAGHWTQVDFGVGDWEWGRPHIAGYSQYSGGKHVSWTFGE
jgi:hypothetical protein